ncbi:uncharacterized protein LOC119075507 [Bradysia coprophila]|uniref:uncharacterized protein LOC119075507 n=1 Tax=Bradysia coprophila TaxID=38358 RepID=UPI00187D8CCD|nr:uncharacterized protein LOC119075507 [Bradysia coprophila]
MEKISILLTIFSCLLFISCLVHAQSQRLQRYNVNPSTVTVSGISAGAAMATQYHFAHSSEVFGVGMIAGLPYNCASGGLVAATMCMSLPNTVNVNNLISQANTHASNNMIDPTSNLRGDRVFIFHGTVDSTVLPASGRNVETMYRHFGGQIRSEFSIAASHGFPTHNFGAACSASSANTAWINNCAYRGAYQVLNYLYDDSLILPADNAAVPGNLITFDQAEFFNWNPSLSAMARDGFVYVPTACQYGAPCRLHIAFHGCLQSSANVGNTFALRAGYLETAEVNNIIVLFPQVIANLSNPNACFDWWGYLNMFFATRTGNQVLATHRMMSRILRG